MANGLSVVQPLGESNPRAEMLRLAHEGKQIHAARIKAYSEGFTAIWEKLIAMSQDNDAKQKALLVQYPELMLIVLSL